MELTPEPVWRLNTVIVVSWLIICIDTTCLPDWLEFNGTSCYYFTNNHTSWSEADLYCKNLGVKLVAIESPEENEFINNEMNKINNNFIWLGCNDESVQYTNWKNGTRRISLCKDGYSPIIVKRTSKWQDYPMGLTSPFIVCETIIPMDLQLVVSTSASPMTCFALDANGRIPALTSP